MEPPVLGGIADEAEEYLRGQIEVHRELGWETIELRNRDGLNITQIDEHSFKRTYAELIRGCVGRVPNTSALCPTQTTD
jgi:hypothetical protein